MSDDFELSGMEPKRRPRTEKKSDGSTQRLMDHFQAQHMARHGVQAFLGTTYGHAMKILKDLIAQVGEDVATEIVSAFFWSRDARVEASGFTVKDLGFHAARLRLSLHGRVETDRVVASHIQVAARMRRVK